MCELCSALPAHWDHFRLYPIKLVTSVDAKDKFTRRESLLAIMLWPILILLVMHSFLGGFFESLGDD